MALLSFARSTLRHSTQQKNEISHARLLLLSPVFRDDTCMLYNTPDGGREGAFLPCLSFVSPALLYIYPSLCLPFFMSALPYTCPCLRMRLFLSALLYIYLPSLKLDLLRARLSVSPSGCPSVHATTSTDKRLFCQISRTSA